MFAAFGTALWFWNVLFGEVPEGEWHLLFGGQAVVGVGDWGFFEHG
jgi:hypothetical protein